MHAYFIIHDSKLVSKLRRRQALVNNFSIVDDLGMITHVFSDKTGTLTENEMKFKTCMIGNQIYGTGQRKKILQRKNTVPSKTRIDQRDQKKLNEDEQAREDFLKDII